MNINHWATMHGVSQQALADLWRLLSAEEHIPDPTPGTKSEAAVQQAVRLEAPKHGVRLWRNNVGAVTTDDERHIRFGLANESAQMNKVVKSSDLIGVTPVTITPDMVGQVMGVFTAYEIKKEGWRYSGKGREAAQLSFMQIVTSMGGIAQFVTSPADIW